MAEDENRIASFLVELGDLYNKHGFDIRCAGKHGHFVTPLNTKKHFFFKTLSAADAVLSPYQLITIDEE